ncbi:hypothetical protein OAK75_00770 [Bacteriovoracales bacterium]|nr:hypothetical protein [Bacteriovoracales bacterium]
MRKRENKTLDRGADSLDSFGQEITMSKKTERAFFKRLDRMLEKKRISLPTLAKKCGIPVSTLYNWSSMGVSPSKKATEYLMAISEYFGKDLETLIFGPEEDFNDPLVYQKIIEENGQRFHIRINKVIENIDTVEDYENDGIALNLTESIKKVIKQGDSSPFKLIDKIYCEVSKAKDNIQEFIKTELDFSSYVHDQNEFQKIKSIQSFKEICREITADRLGLISGLDQIEFRGQTLKNEKRLRRNCVTFILGDLDYAKFNFKVFFDYDDANFIMGSNDKDLDCSKIQDFMCEFCNQAVGGVKRLFECMGDEIPISLPILTRGIDSFFFDVDENRDQIRTLKDSFDLLCGDKSISCEVTFEVYEPHHFYSVIHRAKYEKSKFVDEVFYFI